MKYADLVAATARARRFLSCSNCWAPDEGDHDQVWFFPCGELRSDGGRCHGNSCVVEPFRDGARLGAVEIWASGSCASCAATRTRWDCLDLALSMTEARLTARTTSELASAYGVRLPNNDAAPSTAPQNAIKVSK